MNSPLFFVNISGGDMYVNLVKNYDFHSGIYLMSGYSFDMTRLYRWPSAVTGSKVIWNIPSKDMFSGYVFLTPVEFYEK
jgi:hypothetical protein